MAGRQSLTVPATYRLEGWGGSNKVEGNNFLDKVISNMSFVDKGILVGRLFLTLPSKPPSLLLFFKNKKYV